jgi:hypothetical protein
VATRVSDLTLFAAHGEPHHVRGLDACVVEHRDRVLGHLLEVVGALRLVAAAGAPVVECDRAPAERERGALEVPGVLLRTESLHEEHRGVAPEADHLVVDADTV